MALILVADDDEKVCRWLRTVLEMEGYQVIEAADGQQALRTIQSQSPDLVILDVYLPVQDGLETILRVHSQQIPVKVLAISGQAVQATTSSKLRRSSAHGTRWKNPSAWIGCCSESGRWLPGTAPRGVTSSASSPLPDMPVELGAIEP